MPRTMTAAVEAQIRKETQIAANPLFGILFKELEAEREARDSSEQTIREQCAKVAEAHAKKPWADSHQRHHGNAIAAAIRSGK
jgi:low affinity Fe/Cu permease